MGPLRRLGAWTSDRLGVPQLRETLTQHRVPPGAARGRSAWMYVFGTTTLVAFLLQVVTGIALASVYVPAPAHAYESIGFLTYEVSWGGLLRGMHYFGASAMIVMVCIHMARVFLTASYKFPREVTWISGVVLLALVGLMAFTGQLLRWDESGVWGVNVAAQYVARVPLIGELLKEFVLAGEAVGGPTLTRFFSLHVIALPLLLFAFIGAHLYLVVLHGISEPPEAGRPVDPATYRATHGSLTRHGREYYPYVTWRETAVGVLLVLVVVALAATLGPKGPLTPPDPTLVPTEPKPDWFLVWYYALLALKPGRLETFVMVYLPLLVLLALVALPLVAPRGERAPSRRPWAVALVALVGISLAGLTRLGVQANWVMDFSPEPITAAELGVPPVSEVARGAELFHARGCQSCHAARAGDAAYGPDLAESIRRLSPEAFTARVIQGFGDMPSFRGTITAEELAAIMTFLRAVGER